MRLVLRGAALIDGTGADPLRQTRFGSTAIALPKCFPILAGVKQPMRR
jgi:hypothetical protein